MLVRYRRGSFAGGSGWGARKGVDLAARYDKMTRFRHEMNWVGWGLFILSRAVDETGCVQPIRRALRAFRGAISVGAGNPP